MIELSDADLLLRLTNFEDHFVERKTSGDSKDWLKTVVGFANSVPVGYPAVLYIGLKDGGQRPAKRLLDAIQVNLGLHGAAWGERDIPNRPTSQPHTGLSIGGKRLAR